MDALDAFLAAGALPHSSPNLPAAVPTTSSNLVDLKSQLLARKQQLVHSQQPKREKRDVKVATNSHTLETAILTSKTTFCCVACHRHSFPMTSSPLRLIKLRFRPSSDLQEGQVSFVLSQRRNQILRLHQRFE